MPCYGCQLRPEFPHRPITLSNTNTVACHAKILFKLSILPLILLCAAKIASPQLSRTPRAPAQPFQNSVQSPRNSPPPGAAAPASTGPVPASQRPADQIPADQNGAASDVATVDRPDFSVHIARPDAPPI